MSLFDKDGKIKDELVKKALEHIKTGPDLLMTMAQLTWTPLPDPCPRCNNTTLQHGSNLFSGQFGGQIRCFTEGCDHRESSYHYLGRNLVQVEPMPDGVQPIYEKESGNENS